MGHQLRSFGEQAEKTSRMYEDDAFAEGCRFFSNLLGHAVECFGCVNRIKKYPFNASQLTEQIKLFGPREGIPATDIPFNDLDIALSRKGSGESVSGDRFFANLPNDPDEVIPVIRYVKAHDSRVQPVKAYTENKPGSCAP